LQLAIQAHYARVRCRQRPPHCAGRELGRKLPLDCHRPPDGWAPAPAVGAREIYVDAVKNAFPTRLAGRLHPAGPLHQPPIVGGLDHACCGSPVPLSFEAGQQNRCCWWTWTPAACLSASLPVPAISGFKPVEQPGHAGRAIPHTAADGTPNTWLEVTVAGNDYLADLPVREALTRRTAGRCCACHGNREPLDCARPANPEPS
jgi:exonuclease SbcD